MVTKSMSCEMSQIWQIYLCENIKRLGHEALHKVVEIMMMISILSSILMMLSINGGSGLEAL